MEVGSTVAAHVPYNRKKSKLEWIVATVEGYKQDEKVYHVKDKFPENKKKPAEWTVSEDQVLCFPCKDDVFAKGDIVLSLWYLDEEKEWTSQFYEAIVTDVNDNGKLTLLFRGQDERVEVETSKAVKLPEALIQQQQRRRLDSKKKLRRQRSTSDMSDVDHPPTKKQRMDSSSTDSGPTSESSVRRKPNTPFVQLKKTCSVLQGVLGKKINNFVKLKEEMGNKNQIRTNS